MATRFREVILDGRWIANTNFKNQIEGTTWQQATHKVANLNTLALLTYHVNYYIKGVADALETGNLTISDRYSFDLSPITNQEAWEALQNDLWQNAERFASLLERMDDNALSQGFVDEKYGTNYRNLEGMIEHCYYHLGQVVLIKKMVVQGI